ncbi:unnamed protein product [Phytophthora lilii]|uniref:Unnamed protein product n=1 Tax=Phytophthora lilii TaxID=2077276 RepID=A0A9W6X6S8_9STRA|nr:unnamed protein product [Phytophthora lilii]
MMVNKEAGRRTSASADDGTWRASVKVNKEAGRRTSASADDGTWRASVKVNKEAGRRTSASADDGTWRASVKVNKEAGRRTSASADDGTWRASVKVNKEAGRRTSASADDGTWRASVKVNKEAGRRTSASADDGTWRASVKVNKEAGRRTSASADDGTWRASVKVNKEAGRRTSASADDGTWRASVKVNKEAGRRTSASADDGTWRASVKVNKEAGRRTSASADDGTSRASVKVNKEAGSRSSGDFTDSTDTVTHRTGVRVLNEPGGGGADVYEALYGEPLTWRMEDRLDESTAVGASQDVEMSEDNTVFPIEPSDDVVPSEAALEAGEDEDIVMRGATEGESDLVSIGSDVADKESIDASEESKPTASSAAASRLSLPLVHPFFSGEISAGDSEVLTHILDQTPSAFNDGFTSFASTANCCVEVPVRLVAETLEQVAVSWYRNSLQVVEHLCWLRKLMLMSEGLCMDIFARDFLLGLNSTTHVNWGIGGRLSSALTLAMIEGSVASDAIAQNYYYRTTPTLSQGTLSRSCKSSLTLTVVLVQYWTA